MTMNLILGRNSSWWIKTTSGNLTKEMMLAPKLETLKMRKNWARSVMANPKEMSRTQPDLRTDNLNQQPRDILTIAIHSGHKLEVHKNKNSQNLSNNSPYHNSCQIKNSTPRWRHGSKSKLGNCSSNRKKSRCSFWRSSKFSKSNNYVSSKV